MATNGFPVPQRRPRTRKISGRAFAQAVAGPEQAYPVYQFSGRAFFERPRAPGVTNPSFAGGGFSITTETLPDGDENFEYPS